MKEIFVSLIIILITFSACNDRKLEWPSDQPLIQEKVDTIFYYFDGKTVKYSFLLRPEGVVEITTLTSKKGIIKYKEDRRMQTSFFFPKDCDDVQIFVDVKPADSAWIKVYERYDTFQKIKTVLEIHKHPGRDIMGSL